MTDELVIVSPDAGRVKVARNFARKVGVHWAVMEKERPAQQVAEIGYVVGDVQGQDGGARRRHDRYRRHAVRGREDRARRGRRAGDRLRHARRLLRPRVRAARLRELRDRADRRHRHDPAAPRRPGQHLPCSRRPRRSPTRSGGSSPTTRSPRSSPARTSCSSVTRIPLRFGPKWARNGHESLNYNRATVTIAPDESPKASARPRRLALLRGMATAGDQSSPCRAQTRRPGDGAHSKAPIERTDHCDPLSLRPSVRRHRRR